MIIMKIIEFHKRTMKFNKNYGNPQENNETNENPKIQTRYENYEKFRIPCVNNKICENLRIS